MGELNRWKFPTLIYGDGINPERMQRFSSSTLRFADRRLHIVEVGQECDLAILNGTHGTTMSLLMAGKPTMQIPIYLEQALIAHCVRQMGAGLAAPVVRPEPLVERLREMVRSDRFALAAKRFAEKYADFDAVRENERLVDRIEELVGS